ncbi:MAG: peptidoglycan DD-metalloendopeptidase family protein [Campylobacterales bacterium]|nr:peptidoglycan DD-metalloendopeptidase family protein [Campylobacterales bacterium]
MRLVLIFLFSFISLWSLESQEMWWKRGTTFLTYLEKNNIPQSLYYNLNEDDQDVVHMIFAGTYYHELRDEKQTLLHTLIPISEEMQISIYNNNGTYEFNVIPIDYELVRESVTFKLQSSILYDLKKITGNSKLAIELASVFNDRVDFRQDLRKDDEISIIYERKVRLGKTWGTPNIKAAVVEVNKRKKYAIFNPEDEGYYDENAKPLKGMFLKHPIQYRRISSRFTHRRLHPILKIYRPHYGVDYVARYGTPIKSVADGRVVMAGRKGGYGRTVIVQHKNGWRSLYAHMSGYGRGIKRGRKIKQGKIVGFLGNSGLSTGAHLHFSMYKNHRPFNPARIKSVKKGGLRGKAKVTYLASAKVLQAELDKIMGVSPDKVVRIASLTWAKEHITTN